MTELATYSPERNRLYLRKFDHDDARARRASGESVRALALEYGVSENAVRRVCDPAFAAAMAERLDRTTHTTCECCGNRCLTATHGNRRVSDGRALCRTCRAKERRTGVLVDGDGTTVLAVRCQDCREFLPPDLFPKGQRYPDLRDGGFHSQCRPCGSAARRAYRERNKVPCQKCGQPVEGKGRAKSSRNRNIDPDRPHLCVTCWHARSYSGRVPA